ncbi:MAG: hypothetical protein IH813_00930 [Thaumarchaeota archaeon]|nr:hypothetical protein [Nitrososphaerota archaeon]
MGIKVSAIFLMAVLIAGLSSFPSSISNSSTEFVDQTNSLNLINTVFADSDEDEEDEEKQKGKPEGVGKGQEKKLAQNQVKDDDDDEEDDEDDIQEFSDATVVHMSGTTTICHVPPGNPGNAHEITVSKNALKGHERHGDFGYSENHCAPNGMGDILSIKEIYQAEKLTRLAEKQTEKESMALDRAIKLIEKLEQRIVQLEQRLQTLLDKVESGEYYGTLTQLDTVKQLHSISFDGTATSIYDESVTTGLSGEIFIENLMTGSNTSKFKVTGGEIIVGDNIYDAAFGKVRVSSLGVSGEKDSMVIIIQTFDSEDNDNTIKLTLLFDSAIKADLGTEPINFEIKPNSKISEQWFLSGSGTLSLE